MSQYLIIGAAVLWALLYSAWALMPGAWRRYCAARVAGWARRLGAGEQRADVLQARLVRPTGCSECSSCAGCGRGARATPPAEDGGTGAR
jgi:hypothetical protein